MAITTGQLDRLHSQLLTSGLQNKDQPLYQVINELIKATRQLVIEFNSATTTINNNINNITIESGGNGEHLLNNEGIDGEDGFNGMRGIQGPIGIQGIPGITGEDGIDGEIWIIKS